jgi:ABC-type Mn2+/Zn2+ transport system permease subunit
MPRYDIHQATLGMGTMFAGFVFAALFQLLTRQKLMRGFDVAIGLLLLAMLALTTALICFHATWLRFMKYVGILTPQRCPFGN